jgi:hypothetical protein
MSFRATVVSFDFSSHVEFQLFWRPFPCQIYLIVAGEAAKTNAALTYRQRLSML